ncbi:triose-phosphate isomerase [Biomphalaria pfeifferi]|uniref:Triosephosphate isomerase n=1 Tax=Biomphalaria pfeifferi TaxID=112525 RepID=A0AAD8ETI2_BIOPF|nr:triose-phosphate isomerase [Biomphalaria pfeifferi]
MLKDAGCSHVIIGHSERRQFYGETDESVNKKTKSALSANLTAIVCVGEMLDEREGGKAEEVVKTQLSGSLDGLTVSDMERIIIAYEPVWAIGTGKTATPKQAQEMHGFIRQTLTESHGKETSDKIRILYGGSVKPENIKDLMSETDIDGALVGGASLEAESFSKIVNFNAGQNRCGRAFYEQHFKLGIYAARRTDGFIENYDRGGNYVYAFGFADRNARFAGKCFGSGFQSRNRDRTNHAAADHRSEQCQRRNARQHGSSGERNRFRSGKFDGERSG